MTDKSARFDSNIQSWDGVPIWNIAEYSSRLRRLRASKNIVRRLRNYHWSQWRRTKQR